MNDIDLVITDSGFGGLSLAARLERMLRARGREGCGARVVYVNACPSNELGYNDMRCLARKQQTFARVLQAMEARYSARSTVVACHTLSALLEHCAAMVATPVRGIGEVAAALVCGSLRDQPNSAVLALATATTVSAQPWSAALARAGLDPKRLRARACAGLETLISNDRSGEALDAELLRVAESVEHFGDLTAVLLGCTHYSLRPDAFARAFRTYQTILDPIAVLSESLIVELADTSTTPSFTIEFVSRYAPPPREVETIATLLDRCAPRCAAAVRGMIVDPSMFEVAPLSVCAPDPV